MTPPAPPRLRVLFATKAPICVIIRRGPTKFSQLIEWNTETDVFEPGQWIFGRVDYAYLTSDAKFMLMGLRQVKSKLKHLEDHEISILCRPPYFTAVEVWVGPMVTNHCKFLSDDTLVASGCVPHIVNAKYDCRLQRFDLSKGYKFTDAEKRMLDKKREASRHLTGRHWVDATRRPAEAVDQQGRRVLFEEGKVFALDDAGPRLLFDAGLYSFETKTPPPWVTTW